MSMNPLLGAIGGGVQPPVSSPLQGDMQTIDQNLQGRVMGTPTVTIQDSLFDALKLANKHLVLISRGKEELDIDSVTPQLESMMALMKTIQRDEGGEDVGS
jgi:hypothetical protein